MQHLMICLPAQDTDAKDTAVDLSSIALLTGQGGACLWGRKALAVLQPAGALSAVRLDKPNQSLEIAQCSSDCVIKGLPARAPGTASKKDARAPEFLDSCAFVAPLSCRPRPAGGGIAVLPGNHTLSSILVAVNCSRSLTTALLCRGVPQSLHARLEAQPGNSKRERLAFECP